MYNLFQNLLMALTKLGNDSLIVIIGAYLGTIVSIAIMCYIAYIVSKKIILRIIKKVVEKTATKMDEVFYEQRVFHSLAKISPAIVVYFFASSFNESEQVIENIAMAYIIFVIGIVAFKALDSVVIIFREKSYTKAGPIKGIVQVVKIVAIVFGVLLALVIFIGNAASTVLLGSFGGMSAVLLLIFKDSILGLVAGIQLTVNNLLALGDWVEMTKYNANGEVVDITLTKIVIRNFDKTYTTIPAYKFLEDSFINWQGMTKAGGRRIKRAIYIDMTTINFLTQEQVEFIGTQSGLSDYSINYDSEKKVTNVGIFRQYIMAYLQNHPSIDNNGFTFLVRELPPSEKGLPIEIYCFTNDTNWVNYENIQSEIFEHLLASIEMFGLKVYQYPSASVVMEP